MQPTEQQWQDIVSAEHDIVTAEKDVAEKTEILKEAKRQLEARIEALRNLIQRAKDGPDLFDATAWRSMPTSVLASEFGLSDSLAETLSDKNHLVDMGKVVDHMNENGDNWAKHLKGVGPAKAEAICDAMAAFNAKYRASEIEPERTSDGNAPWKRMPIESLGDYGVTEETIEAIRGRDIYTIGALDAQSDNGRMQSLDEICNEHMAQARVVSDALKKLKGES